MKTRKLRRGLIPGLIGLLLIGISITSIKISGDNNMEEENIRNEYVTDTIIQSQIPVLNPKTKIINPYTNASVTVGKSYYDYKADSASQEKSIIYHDNTYIQNSGVDFISDEVYDVLSILPGTVINVIDDETLGKTVEIKHDNDMVSIYQSLSEISVKKGDVVSQGQLLGKSGNNEIDKEIGNHLHFELYVNGQIVDPLLYLDKELNVSTEKE